MPKGWRLQVVVRNRTAGGGRPNEWLAEAMLTVRDEPHLSDAEIARRVRVNRSTLSRSKTYQAAAAMARGNRERRPSGIVVSDRDGQLSVDGVTEQEEAD